MGGTIKSMKLYWQVERIETELRALGITEDDPLAVEDLLPFDQYHYRGTAAVDEALAALEVGPGHHLLDVGAGLGGPARYMAQKAGCRVTALELQPDLNETGARLTARCGLGERLVHGRERNAYPAVPQSRRGAGNGRNRQSKSPASAERTGSGITAM